MARKPLSAKPPHGQELVKRRFALGKLSQDDIEERTNGIVYKQLLYRLENGLTHPRSLNHEQERALALALEWTVTEYRERMGLPPIPNLNEQQVLDHNSIPASDVDIPFVDAGAGLPQWNDDSSSTIRVSVPETRGRKAKEMFAVRIMGTSMHPYARDGDLVIFERTRVADLGKVVAVHIPDDGLIVKRYLGVSKDGHLLLSNDNPDLEPKVFEAPEGAAIYGASLGSWKPDP